MATTRKIITLSLAVILLTGAVPALVACSAPQFVQDAVSGAVKDATGVDVNLDGNTLPDGFPTEVPTISGDIKVSGSLGVGADKVWTVSIAVADLAAGFEEATGKLLAAGFTSDFDASADGASTGIFTNATYTAMVTATNDGTNNTVTYVVSGKAAP
jgi:hypothetical protein